MTVLARELDVPGAVEFTPRVFHDDRGRFTTSFQAGLFGDAVGQPLFQVAQASFSRSRRGVVRGVHYTATPPGCAKYVTCVRGAVLDVVVDLRVGSPTLGRWVASELDEESGRALYLPVGVGHAFAALTDDAVVTYLLSVEYVPENELALAPFDPDLGLPLPRDGVLSERDATAPSLAAALKDGLLPRWEQCVGVEPEGGAP